MDDRPRSVEEALEDAVQDDLEMVPEPSLADVLARIRARLQPAGPSSEDATRSPPFARSSLLSCPGDRENLERATELRRDNAASRHFFRVDLSVATSSAVSLRLARTGQ